MAGWPPFGPYGPGAGWPPRGFAGPFDGPSAGWMWGDPTYPPKFYYDAVPSEPNVSPPYIHIPHHIMYGQYYCLPCTGGHPRNT